MYILQYIKGKHRNKYVKEVVGGYWDEVLDASLATTYASLEDAHKRILFLCAKVGDELPLKPKKVDSK